MSRITTSLASFSWARPAMRRACSSDVSRFRLLRRATAASLAAPPAPPIEPEPLDLGGHRRGDETVDRLATRHAVADPPRGDVDRLDLEERHPVGPGDLGQHPLQPVARIAGPCRDTEPRELEHAVRVLPAQEV